MQQPLRSYRPHRGAALFLVLLVACLSSFTATAQDNDYREWTDIGDGPFARNESQTIVYGGEMYCFFGFDAGLKILTDVSKFNPISKSWTTVGGAPTDSRGATHAVTHYGAALVDDTAWIIGGRRGRHPGKVTNKVWRYNIPSGTWTEGPNLPFPAGGGGAARLGNKIHYVGGFDPQACRDVDAHLVYDLDAPGLGWQDYSNTSPMPEDRNHFGAAVLNGQLYVIGGQNGHDCGGGNVAFVHSYDPYTDTWTRRADLPSNESHIEGSTFSLDGKIYVFGGQASGDRVLEYAPDSDDWRILNDYKLPRRLLGPNARVFDQTAYVSAGGAPVSSSPIATVWAHNFNRAPVEELAFNPAALDIDLDAGESQTIETHLLNRNGEASVNYTLNINDFPTWLSSDVGSGSSREAFVEVNFTIDADGLNEGVYAYTVRADAGGYQSATMRINLTVGNTPPPRGTEDEVLYRINAGSTTQTVRGVTWVGCPNANNCGAVVAGGFAYRERTSDVVQDVPADMNQDIFKTEWTGGRGTAPVGGVAFSYGFDVPEADYRVRLHFAELNKFAPNTRVFGVNIEDATVLDNYDLFVEAGGANKAIVREFTTTVSDGTLNIDFIRIIENAKISAIEVIKIGDAAPEEPENFTLALEAECAAVGSNWLVSPNGDASNGSYVEIAPGFDGRSGPPADVAANQIRFDVDVPANGEYHLYARLNAPTDQDNSFWVRVDGGQWGRYWQGIPLGVGFVWDEVLGSPFTLSPGAHRIDFAYREDGTQFDKLILTDLDVSPSGGDQPADNCDVGVAASSPMVLEAECGTVGDNWNVVQDSRASGGTYVTVRDGLNSTGGAPADVAENIVAYRVGAPKDDSYRIFARIVAPNGGDDSFYVRIDGGAWIQWWRGLRTGDNFEWREVLGGPFDLTQGEHLIEFAYREDGTLLDKLVLSAGDAVPSGDGPAAENCDRSNLARPKVTLARQRVQSEGVRLYPNPVDDQLTVDLRALETTGVTVQVMDALGREVYRRDARGQSSLNVSVKKWQGGTYYLRILGGPDDARPRTIFVQH